MEQYKKNYATPKQEMIDFIKKHYENDPNKPKLSENPTLREIKSLLEKNIEEREKSAHNEDELEQDQILNYAYGYFEDLSEERIQKEEANINFARNVSLASSKRLPREIEDKIKIYGIETPVNPKPEYYKRKNFGGKTKRNKKQSRKTKRNKKQSRKTKRKTIKIRKKRKYKNNK